MKSKFGNYTTLNALAEQQRVQGGTFDLRVLMDGSPTVFDYVKGQSLTVNVLWEVAYGVFKEILHLNSLEDFNATQADLMDLKNDILTTWKSRDKHRTSSLRPMFTPSSVGPSEKKSTLGDTFTPSKAMVPAPIHVSILSSSSHGLGEMPSPLVRPLGPLPGILYPSISMSYRQRIFPTSNYPALGSTIGYNFNPMMGQPL